MSVQIATPDTYTCSHQECEEEYTKPGSVVDGSYCSRRCSLLDTGEDFLRNIRDDHRWCGGCYRQLKEVEAPPPGSYPEFVIGFEYLTEHAELGQREANADSFVDDARADSTTDGDRLIAPMDRLTVGSAVCECGTTDHRDGWVREVRLTSIYDTALRLCRAIEHTGREGQHEKTIDAERLTMLLKKSAEKHGSLNWELAVGYALDG